jgi:hypothetical protein
MARPTPYLFCRYEISKDEDALSGKEQLALFEKMRGKSIAYRVRDPSSDDETTFLMRPRQRKFQDYLVLTWRVADQLNYRERTRYDTGKDEEFEEYEETDEIRRTAFVALPELGVMAVDDKISERSLGARSAIGRFIELCAQLGRADARVIFAGTSKDVQKALDTWELDKFSFTVRRFNPTIRKPGEKLHELMDSDDIAVMRGVALPAADKKMKDSHEGLIAETKGLADAGYGQIGASGVTPDGFHASLSKPKFDMDKQKNKERQGENRSLKVYIPSHETISKEEEAVVKALLELYG